MAKIQANMTGTVLRVLVKVGDTVNEDQDVIAIESMKMEMMIPSTAQGKVTHILVKPEDFVQEGQDLLVIE